MTQLAAGGLVPRPARFVLPSGCVALPGRPAVRIQVRLVDDEGELLEQLRRAITR